MQRKAKVVVVGSSTSHQISQSEDGWEDQRGMVQFGRLKFEFGVECRSRGADTQARSVPRERKGRTENVDPYRITRQVANG